MASVLIVDDDDQIRLLLGDILTEHGFDVFEGLDGMETVGLLETIQPDLLLLDILMPNMDGIELLREIANREIDVPVIVLTGATDEGLPAKAIEAGAAAFMTKPLEMKSLMETISKVMPPLDHLGNYRISSKRDMA